MFTNLLVSIATLSTLLTVGACKNRDYNDTSSPKQADNYSDLKNKCAKMNERVKAEGGQYTIAEVKICIAELDTTKDILVKERNNISPSTEELRNRRSELTSKIAELHEKIGAMESTLTELEGVQNFNKNK